MPPQLDVYVFEETRPGQWGSCTRFPHPNPRLITALVRRLIENDIRHPGVRRINIVLSPAGVREPEVRPSAFSPKWRDVWVRGSPEDVQAAGEVERDRWFAGVVFDAVLAVLPEGEEATRVREIRTSFEGHYDSRIGDFACREKRTKTYRVVLWYTINWGPERPFYVAYVDHEDLRTGVSKRASFALRGSENTLFGLAGRIAVKGGVWS